MVDSPRFHPRPVKELGGVGGVKLLFLSHQDGVADHEKFHAHFGCERIIHQKESAGIPGMSRSGPAKN